MKRQHYFPKTVADRPEWFGNYATQLNSLGAGLGLVAGEVTASIADARYLEYCTGSWLTAVREFGPAATAALDTLFDVAGPSPFVLPAFAAPTLPPASPPFPAVVAVAPGALQRIFAFVQTIKARPAYTEAIGLQLGIVGAEDAATNPLPTFTLALDHTGGVVSVKVNFKKYGHPGVAVWGRRGNGAWELLGIDLSTPYLDSRPLLVAGAPEVREYRLQFFDGNSPVGEFTPVQSATVAP